MNKPENLEEAEKILTDLLDTQHNDGTWNYDSYLHGLANGLIIALSVLNGEDPKFRKAPECYLSQLDMLDKFNESCIIVDNNK